MVIVFIFSDRVQDTLQEFREKGTLRFFRKKVNQRNVTADIKHYEDGEQLFF